MKLENIYIVRGGGILYLVWLKEVSLKLKSVVAKCKTKLDSVVELK